VAPLAALSAMLVGNPENRLYLGLPAAVIFTAMQWLVPKCRFRSDQYLSPVNLAQFLMLLKLVVAPALIAILGPAGSVLSALPSTESMEGALAIDLIAYVSLCLGLAFVSDSEVQSERNQPWPGPTPVMAALFAILGLLGFLAEFGSPARLMQYFTEPLAVTQKEQMNEGTLVGLFGTFLRPFFAFSLVAFWTNLLDRGRTAAWILNLTGLAAAVGIALANMTFSFNRAAFVFPLIAFAAIYQSRVRRIPFALTGGVAALALPILLMVSSYRTNLMAGTEGTSSLALSYASDSVADNIQGYAVGPQYTGLFYDQVRWGQDLFAGETLVASAMSPVPVLGKGFRDTSGPALFNRAIYGIGGIEDQILPFNAELFANFHLPGTVIGLMIVGFTLGTAEKWIASAKSSFVAFSIQYAAIWAAMLAAWSLAIYSQILIYFFGPVYFFILATYSRQWLRQHALRSLRWSAVR
jgi:hypothetical protein